LCPRIAPRTQVRTAFLAGLLLCVALVPLNRLLAQRIQARASAWSFGCRSVCVVVCGVCCALCCQQRIITFLLLLLLLLMLMLSAAPDRVCILAAAAAARAAGRECAHDGCQGQKSGAHE
jgi:hypothetical protein